MKEKAAKIIRILTVPPILAAAMIVLLHHHRPDIFHSAADYAAALVGLSFLPILAYPICAVIPRLRERGREGQRNLAFIGTLAGYTLVFLYGECSGAGPELCFIFRTYFVAAVLLTFVNRLLKVRASGHGCSVTAPALFLCHYVGWTALPICVLLIAASFWGSLALKRHRPTELIGGASVCAVSFMICYLL